MASFCYQHTGQRNSLVLVVGKERSAWGAGPLLRAIGIFGGFLNTWVRPEEVGSQTPGSSRALKAAVGSGSRFLFQRADAVWGELGRPNLHSRALSVAAVSSSGYAAGRQPD